MAEKKELKITDGTKEKQGTPKFVTSNELRSMVKLYEIVEKHGVVYLNVRNDMLPLKITKATLV